MNAWNAKRERVIEIVNFGAMKKIAISLPEAVLEAVDRLAAHRGESLVACSSGHPPMKICAKSRRSPHDYQMPGDGRGPALAEAGEHKFGLSPSLALRPKGS